MGRCGPGPLLVVMVVMVVVAVVAAVVPSYEHDVGGSTGDGSAGALQMALRGGGEAHGAA